ncbi:hypothetical protein, partial [Saccharothrix sp. Mg75]|uniref:hypothetical protein n=1 Tax=Saccharothrix sp. Mg75 TaxID=3445357 RepID=UPI003EEA4477
MTPSVTTWTRLTPRVTSADIRESVAARVEDAAWLLCRQWQLGEFDGSDGGSPVSARLRVRAGAIGGFRGLGDGAPLDDFERLDTTTTPLEAVVERTAPDPDDLALRAEGGRRFLRLLGPLRARYGQSFTDAFPLPEVVPGPTADDDAVAEAAFLRGRVPDADALAAALGGTSPGGAPTLPAVPEVAAADRAAVLAAAASFTTWWRELVSRPGTNAASWSSRRLEHSFVLGTRLGDDEVVLSAPEYPGGTLDWYDLRLSTSGESAPADTPSRDLVRTGMPSPVRYPGMPTDRWWEFEDAPVSFAGAETGPSDLGRLLVLEFATLYANDWFVVPVELPVGTVARVRSLVVTDTFGVRTEVDPAARPGWDMYRLPGSTPAQSLFVLPPALPGSLEGDPVEDVVFLRDEAANAVWAVERTVEGVAGVGVDRQGRYAPAPEPRVVPGADLSYALRSALPPDHWAPLLPEFDPDGARLRRVLLPVPGGAPAQPAGRTLEGTDWVAAEEVPRDGVRVARRWQLARWTDGSTHLWLSRRRSTGRGEAGSDLRHDIV